MRTTRVVSLALIVVGAGAVFGCNNNDNAIQVTYTQVDRMGIPAVNTALIPAANKEAFNQGAPASDVANWLAPAKQTIGALRRAVNGVEGFPAEDAPGLDSAAVAGALIPDIVTINFTQPVQFPNGRRLQDDVIDAALGLVLNRGNPLGGGPGVPDGIAANDHAFSSTFPYEAAPNTVP